MLLSLYGCRTMLKVMLDDFIFTHDNIKTIITVKLSKNWFHISFGGNSLSENHLY